MPSLSRADYLLSSNSLHFIGSHGAKEYNGRVTEAFKFLIQKIDTKSGVTHKFDLHKIYATCRMQVEQNCHSHVHTFCVAVM